MSGEDITLPGLARIRAHFLAALGDEAEVIAEALKTLEQGMTPRRSRFLLGEIQLILARLAGSSAMVGFEELGEAAAYCERAVRAQADAPHRDSGEVIDLLGRFLRGIEAMPEMQPAAGSQQTLPAV